MTRILTTFTLFVLAAALASCQLAPQSTGPGPVADPVLDPPTLHCLGAYWLIRDADDHPASVTTDYRKAGSAAWIPGPPFLRVMRDNPELHKVRFSPFISERGEIKTPAVPIPDGAHMFAGSLFILEPDTTYEWRLTLHNADGSSLERILKDKTIAEPVVSPTAPRLHVVPGSGGGTGTQADPFKGLPAADAAAKPGTVFLVHAGIYPAIDLHASGQPGKPIVWQGAGDGETVISANEPHGEQKNPAINAWGLHDVWFQKLTACNARSGIACHESANIVIQRCTIHDVLEGIYCTVDKTGSVHGFFISDNILTGMFKWPVTHDEWKVLPESRAIWICGMGHVACYNRITGWKDGLDTDESPHTVSVDFHNNDVSEQFDDGCEMDGSDRNCRNFYNRYTNTLTCVSFQPVHGGPIYAFRNVSYNLRGEPFKLHDDPAGAVIFHNTIIRRGTPVYVASGAFAHNCWERNNLFVGTEGRAFNYDVNTVDCDFDYDGVAGWSGPVFIKWNKVMYPTPAEAREKCPVEKHCIILDPARIFASGLLPPADDKTVFDPNKIDPRLAKDSPARHVGQPLPWANDGDTGPADLGAFKYDAPLPHYGPR